MDVYVCVYVLGFSGGSVVKNLPAMQEPKETRVKSLRRLPGGGHGSPLQYSCLENPMDRRAWGATVHRVTEWGMIEAI